MNETALAVRTRHLTNLSLPELMNLGKILQPTGLLPGHIRTPEQAVAIMLKGQELFVPPMYAMSNIIVIKGKPTANAELMAALIYRDHGDDALDFVESTADRCTIAYKRRTASQRRQFTFTMQEAKAAGLTDGNWKSYPGAMLRARCISAVARMAFPDSIGGMYTPDELGHSEDADGEFVTITPPELSQPATLQLNGAKPSTKKKFSVTDWLDWFRASKPDDEPATTEAIDEACEAWDKAMDHDGSSGEVVFWATDGKGFDELGKHAVKALRLTATHDSFTDADRQQLMKVAAVYAEQVTAGQEPEAF